MKTLDSNFLTALSAEVRTITRCARLVRTDGKIFGLTEFDRDLTFAGTTYRAYQGLSPTAYQADLGFQSNNIQLNGLLSEDGITEAHLRSGLFDYARIEMFLINYLDLPTNLSANPPNHLILPVRSLGRVSYSEGDYTAELMGLSRFLEGRISNSTSRTCRYNLGDNRCGVNIGNFSQTMTVNNSLEPLSFFATVSAPVDRYTGGKITLLSGPNDGLTVPILKNSGTQFFLSAALPSPLAGGENFLAIPNCQKRLEDCRFFNNQPNFGGEDNLPGLDAYIGQER